MPFRRINSSEDSAPAQIVRTPVPVEARAKTDHTTTSEIIRKAIRRFLTVIDLGTDVVQPHQVLAIGSDPAGTFVEVIWLELADDLELVIHAMALRPNFYELLLPG